ncbi:MAG: GAF domain-containing protein [Cyanobacteria bacterium J069]|nr:MAG: GAF domain-containing protein [Cyanobacteria bacterium J069]
MGLQQVSLLVQSFGDCQEPEDIVRRTTDGLVETFDCAFARIWLMESDGKSLRLVASSGLYTRIDGSFARVPVGAFKVGKIAQNRIPFLSNNLPNEAWVKDRDWAIANQITGFAGYPLAIGDRVIGVLAVFSHRPLSPEFLEVLQSLCTTLAVMLESGLRRQQAGQAIATLRPHATAPLLSEQIAQWLPPTRLSLVGTERGLSPAIACLFLRLTETLSSLSCTYCRLSYAANQVMLEAMIAPPPAEAARLSAWSTSVFGELHLAATCLGGTLQTRPNPSQNVLQVVLQLPDRATLAGPMLRVVCTAPALQLAWVQLVYLAGLQVSSTGDADLLLLTDDPAEAASASRVLWLQTCPQPLGRPAPSRNVLDHILGYIDLTTSPAQLRQAVETVLAGKPWPSTLSDEQKTLSDREHEILTLLAQGLRDRDIADRLIISESTVKFHLNNVLSKLQVQTRYQAIYQATRYGWI